MSDLQTRWEIAAREELAAQQAVGKAQKKLDTWRQSRYKMELAMAWEAGWKAGQLGERASTNPHLISTP